MGYLLDDTGERLTTDSGGYLLTEGAGNMASTDARPIPMRGVAYRVTFPMQGSDGGLVPGAASARVSMDGADYAASTSAPVEIGPTSGTHYLDLSAEEMAADTVAVIAESTGAKPTLIVLYPAKGGEVMAPVQLVMNGGVINFSVGSGSSPAGVTYLPT